MDNLPPLEAPFTPPPSPTTPPPTPTVSVPSSPNAASIPHGRVNTRRIRAALSNVTNRDIRRCARRAGVKRLTQDVSESAHAALKEFLTSIIRDATSYTSYASRKTVIKTVGKIKEKFYTDAIAEYSKRLSRYCKLEIIQVSDEKSLRLRGSLDP